MSEFYTVTGMGADSMPVCAFNYPIRRCDLMLAIENTLGHPDVISVDIQPYTLHTGETVPPMLSAILAMV